MGVLNLYANTLPQKIQNYHQCAEYPEEMFFCRTESYEVGGFDYPGMDPVSKVSWLEH